VSDPACLNCGTAMPRKYRQSTSDWQSRKYCSKDCFYAHKYPFTLGPAPQCQKCGGPIQRAPGRSRRNWMRRKFCSDACRPRKLPDPAVWEDSAADFIEDVEDLFRLGADQWEVCRRLKSNPDAIARRLLRWGRGDLARGFWSLRRQAKREGKAA
jgi:hypothetical protein